MTDKRDDLHSFSGQYNSYNQLKNKEEVFNITRNSYISVDEGNSSESDQSINSVVNHEKTYFKRSPERDVDLSFMNTEFSTQNSGHSHIALSEQTFLNSTASMKNDLQLKQVLKVSDLYEEENTINNTGLPVFQVSNYIPKTSKITQHSIVSNSINESEFGESIVNYSNLVNSTDPVINKKNRIFNIDSKIIDESISPCLIKKNQASQQITSIHSGLGCVDSDLNKRKNCNNNSVVF